MRNALLDDLYDQEWLDCEDSLLDETQCNPEQERELLFFATSFIGEVRYIAKQYISNFFNDKSFFCGGKIPKSLLLKDSSISMVINYDIIQSVNKAYDSLKDYEFPNNNSEGMPGDISLVVNILNILSKADIPQQFAGGMMLLYLKLVEGIEIGKQ